MANAKKGKKGKKTTKKGSTNVSLRTGAPTGKQRVMLGSQNVARMGKLCALTNPFCDAAKGARIPDDDAAFSTAFQFRTTVHLTTIGTQASITIAPNPGILYKQGATYSGNEITTFGSFAAASDYTTAAAQFSQYRIVSLGARFFNTTSPLNQSGTYRAVTTSANSSNGIVVDGGMWNSVANATVTDLDLHWISKPVGVGWKEYRVMNDTADYDFLTVIFNGLPNAATVGSAVACEIILNVEVIAAQNTVVSALTTPGEAHDQTVISAASRVHSSHGGVHSSSPSLFQKLAGFATRALTDVAATYMPVAGNALKQLLLPSQPSTRYPMIVD